MCTVLIAFKQHPSYPLIVLSNRDEFYTRASEPSFFWKDTPQVYAGKDLVAGGTWLGLTLNQRMSVVTNYRDMRIEHNGLKTRGVLPLDFLMGELSSFEYATSIKRYEKQFDPFNLIVFDGEELVYLSNMANTISILAPGYYGLSNALLDTTWHKVERGKSSLKSIIDCACYTENPMSTNQLSEKLMSILWDESEAPEVLLPDTGLSREHERLLSRMHIASEEYGTRFKTVALLDIMGIWHVYDSYLENDMTWRDKKCTLGIG